MSALVEFLTARIAYTPERLAEQAESGDDMHQQGEPCSFCEKTWAARRLVDDADLSPALLDCYEQRALAAIWADHPDFDATWAP